MDIKQRPLQDGQSGQVPMASVLERVTVTLNFLLTEKTTHTDNGVFKVKNGDFTKK